MRGRAHFRREMQRRGRPDPMMTGGNRYLQTVEAACLEKVRDRDFHRPRRTRLTIPGHPARCGSPKHRACRRHAARWRSDRCASPWRNRDVLAGQRQGRTGAVAKDPMPAGQAQLRIDDDPVRVVSGAPPNRQLRVVGPYGFGHRRGLRRRALACDGNATGRPRR